MGDDFKQNAGLLKDVLTLETGSALKRPRSRSAAASGIEPVNFAQPGL